MFRISPASEPHRVRIFHWHIEERKYVYIISTLQLVRCRTLQCAVSKFFTRGQILTWVFCTFKFCNNSWAITFSPSSWHCCDRDNWIEPVMLKCRLSLFAVFIGLFCWSPPPRTDIQRNMTEPKATSTAKIEYSTASSMEGRSMVKHLYYDAFGDKLF